MKNNKKHAINICLTFDDNYAPHAGALVASVLQNFRGEETLNFFVVHAQLSQKNIELLTGMATSEKSCIKFFKVDTDELKKYGISKNGRFLQEVFFRLKLSSYLKDLEKVIFLDSDLIVFDNIQKLWQTDIENFALAAAADVTNFDHLKDITGPHTYFNAGVLVFNLKKWREDNIEQKLFDFFVKNQERIIWNDQDLLNAVLFSEVRYLDPRWNFQYNVENDECFTNQKVSLVHFITRYKPWNTFHRHYRYRDAYFSYLMKTPWRLKVFSFAAEMFLKRNFYPCVRFFDETAQLRKLKKLSKNKRTVIWGASNYIEALISRHNPKIREIVGIVDKNPAKKGKFIGALRVYAPSSLGVLKPDLIISGVINHPKMKHTILQETRSFGLNVEVVDDLFYLRN